MTLSWRRILSWALFLTGCAESSATLPTVTISPAAQAPPDSAAPRRPPTPAAPRASGRAIGVPACDAYVAQYEACVAGMPASAFAAQRDAWRAAAATPEGQAMLQTVCEKALAALQSNALCN
jgi:hypothetical protein